MSKIILLEGDLNTTFIVRLISKNKEEREICQLFIQSDYDYPGIASSFGWQPFCKCKDTDGTISCKHKSATEHISDAYQYLCDNIGKKVEDPGYFL